MSNVEVSMNRYSLQLAILITLLNFLTESTAQLNNNNNNDNRAQLPTTAECGYFTMNKFVRRSGSVAPEEFPWMAMIAYEGNKDSSLSYHCLAVLITSRYLLTVAHCVERVGELEPFAVLIGDLTDFPANSANQQIAIDELIVHPYYNQRELWNDIALLGLNRSVSFTELIHPICLPTADMVSKVYGIEQLMLAGYYKRDKSLSIHKLPVVVGNANDCNRKYLGILNITDSHLCGIACFETHQYMSASALMDAVEYKNYYLVGLLSAGYKMCTYPEQPDVFTRVDRYLDWILENIAQ